MIFGTLKNPSSFTGAFAMSSSLVFSDTTTSSLITFTTGIAWLIGFTKQNGGIDYARAQMDGFRNRALQLLERFPQSDVRRSLETYVDYVIDRVK